MRPRMRRREATDDVTRTGGRSCANVDQTSLDVEHDGIPSRDRWKNMKNDSAWLFFALGSALFGGATAILAKVGVEGIDSNLATFYRTLVVVALAGLVVSARGEWGGFATVPAR